jgi:hypothetical protein
MSSGNSMRKRLEQYKQNKIKNARHGEFFFAKWSASDGYVRESPCLIISDHQDPHDEIIILKVTKQPAKTDFDIPVTLKEPSHVRTNKVYTIQRNQLLFPIPQTTQPEEYSRIINKLKEAMKIDQ